MSFALVLPVLNLFILDTGIAFDLSCTEFVYPVYGHCDNGARSKIDDVILVPASVPLGLLEFLNSFDLVGWSRNFEVCYLMCLGIQVCEHFAMLSLY